MPGGSFRPSLRALQTLETVIRHRKLTHAAAELGVSVPAVSSQLREIEQAVGRKLVSRNGRTLRIDRAASEAAADMNIAFSMLRSVATKLHEAPQNELLRVGMLPNFAAVWFLPRLSQFHADCPQIDIQIVTGTGLVDFPSDEIDCCIRCGPSAWPNLDCTWLFDQKLSPVAHRLYLKNAGWPSNPAELERHQLIATRGRIVEWQEWFQVAEGKMALNTKFHLVDGRDLALAAVLGKGGIALLDLSLIRSALEVGDLVQLFPTELLTGWGHWFVTGAGNHRFHVDRFRRRLLEEASLI